MEVSTTEFWIIFFLAIFGGPTLFLLWDMMKLKRALKKRTNQ